VKDELSRRISSYLSRVAPLDAESSEYERLREELLHELREFYRRTRQYETISQSGGYVSRVTTGTSLDVLCVLEQFGARGLRHDMMNTQKELGSRITRIFAIREVSITQPFCLFFEDPQCGYDRVALEEQVFEAYR
jgi:hypothetical protein